MDDIQHDDGRIVHVLRCFEEEDWITRRWMRRRLRLESLEEVGKGGIALEGFVIDKHSKDTKLLDEA